MRFKYLVLFVFLSIFVTSFSAAAQTKIRWNALVEEDLVRFLLSNNMEEAQMAAKELGKRKTQSSLDELLGQLLLGHPPRLAISILESAGSRKSPSAFKTFVYFTSHRNVNMRITALKALADIDTRKDQKMLAEIDSMIIRALRDMNSGVRDTAAFLIGKRRIRTAEGDLLKLFNSGSKAAIDALGYVGGIITARTFLIALDNKKISKEILISSLLTMLKRADFGPEPVRIQIVKVLGALNLPGAQDALIKYHGTGPEKFGRSRRLAFKILSR
ncbi:hypothetical protein KKF34_04565 [Myxococcota bacterium]|nr:hypothetical protein [Myxococcota bacterium]MBU1379710.1 hypothetical protein [Myxococcota bacterium]MBU1496132.1 hypothetical protein [Myxococcota bacterium]